MVSSLYSSPISLLFWMNMPCKTFQVIVKELSSVHPGPCAHFSWNVNKSHREKCGLEEFKFSRKRSEGSPTHPFIFQMKRPKSGLGLGLWFGSVPIIRQKPHGLARQGKSYNLGEHEAAIIDKEILADLIQIVWIYLAYILTWLLVQMFWATSGFLSIVSTILSTFADSLCSSSDSVLKLWKLQISSSWICSVPKHLGVYPQNNHSK